MTARAWLLLIAAAVIGTLTALFWPESSGPAPLHLPDLELTDGDVELFLKVADQLEADRQALLVDLPEGVSLLHFAADWSRRPAKLAGTCERAGTSPARFLGIVAALGKAQQLDAALIRWDADAEARQREADLTAEILDIHGRPVPQDTSASADPPWLSEKPPNERANVEVWRRHADRVAGRWAELMHADRLR